MNIKSLDEVPKSNPSTPQIRDRGIRNLTIAGGAAVLGAIFLVLAVIFSALGFLPFAILPFNGVYFIIGSFFAFTGGIILSVGTGYFIRSLLQRAPDNPAATGPCSNFHRFLDRNFPSYRLVEKRN